MDEIDHNTCVLEPENPKRSENKRRFVVGKHVSLQVREYSNALLNSIKVTVNPLSPCSVPECRFLGADAIIQPFKHKLNSNLLHWDTKQHLLSNLERVLETTFPTKMAVESLDLKAECAICYSYKLEESIPDIVCDGHGCEKVSSTRFRLIHRRCFTRIACTSGWKARIRTDNHWGLSLGNARTVKPRLR